MITVERILIEKTDDELKEAFINIKNWRESGTLPIGSIIRAWHNEFETKNNMEVPIYVMEGHILYEISRRHFKL